MMKYKKSLSVVLCLALLVLFAGAAFAQEESAKPDPLQGPYDLGRCVDRALKANPDIMAARAALKGAGYGVNSKAGEFLFKTSVNYGYTRYDQYPTYGEKDRWTGHLNLSQPLFKGFALLSDFQKAKLTEEQTDAQLYNAELVVIQNVQSNFLALLKARMDVKSAQDSVERLESQLQVTTAFYEVGLQPRVDVLQAEVDLATARQNLLTANNTVSTQITRLNTLLNLPIEADIDYVGSLEYMPVNLQLQDCLKRAYKSRPDIEIGQKSVDIALKDAKIAASSFYPQVSADFDYYKVGDDPDMDGGDRWTHSASEYWTAGVNMNWTIFEFGADYQAWKQTKQNVKRLEADLEQTRLNAGFEVKKALLDLREAADRIDVSRKSVESAKESYRMAVARYQAQVGTNNDVLDAQARVSDSEAELNGALADYNTALVTLYVAMGEKNTTLESE